jgi:hypothetical protein
MPFYSAIETRQQERIALAAGSYGTGKEPGLKIASYIGVKPDKTGAARHNFLVTAIRPSREQLQAVATNGHEPGAGNLGPDFEGTAFFPLTIHELWLAPESIALAFTEASRNKEGAIQQDYIAAALQDGSATPESIGKAKAHFVEVARNKVTNANTPEDQFEQAATDQYRKEMLAISIKIGQFFTLQDWKTGSKAESDWEGVVQPASLSQTGLVKWCRVTIGSKPVDRTSSSIWR